MYKSNQELSLDNALYLIDHNLDYNYVESCLFKERFFPNLFDKIIEETNNSKTFEMGGELFDTITIKGLENLVDVKNDPDSVLLECPRHRSLYDFVVAQPAHYFNINKDVMLASGDNLFVPYFGEKLRKFGAFMYMRKNRNVSRDHIKGKIDISKYNSIYLPNFLNESMIKGSSRHLDENQNPIIYDMILFPEYYEKNGVLGSGRTKNGKLNNMSTLIPLLLYRSLKKSDSQKEIYIIPSNISLSSYPDTLFLDNNTLISKIKKPIKYISELNYIFNRYPKFSKSHQNGKLNATVHYGNPIKLSDFSVRELSSKNFNSDSLSSILRTEVGKLETIYPATILFRAMGNSKRKQISDLNISISELVEFYQSCNVDVSLITDKKGNVIPIDELINKAKNDVNSNPVMFMHPNSSRHVLDVSKNEVTSRNYNIHSWYANTIKHLEEMHGKEFNFC
jgi:hypothetical protein